jgi:hypothetical protein
MTKPLDSQLAPNVLMARFQSAADCSVARR